MASHPWREADVVVVGGGVAGFGLAFHLVNDSGAGCRVVLIDEGVPGLAETRNGIGVTTTAFAEPELQRLAMETRGFLTSVARSGLNPFPYHRTGSLVLARTDEEIAGLEQEAERARAIEELAVVLTAEQVAWIAPSLEVQRLRGGLWRPYDGWVKPNDLLDFYWLGSNHRGVDVVCNVRVEAVDLEAGRVAGVLTAAGRVRAPVVVDAAGVAFASLGPAQVLQPKVEEDRFIAAALRLKGAYWENLPVFLERGTGFVGRSSPEGMEVARRDPRGLDGAGWDWAGVVDLVAMAANVYPLVDEDGVERSWIGYDVRTSDGLPVAGPIGPEGFWVLAAFGGWGLSLAPGTARGLARAIRDGASPDRACAPARLVTAGEAG